MNSSLRGFTAQIFRALAHPTRIAVVDALRDGEMTAGDLQAKLKVEQANLSQHLAVLRSAQVVVTRRAGNQVIYAIRDPILTKVLDLLKRYLHGRLSETQALLREMNPAGGRRRASD